MTIHDLRVLILEERVWHQKVVRIHEATARRQEARIRVLGNRIKVGGKVDAPSGC